MMARLLHVWLPRVIDVDAALQAGSEAISGVIPSPPAAFSPLTMTKWGA